MEPEGSAVLESCLGLFLYQTKLIKNFSLRSPEKHNLMASSLAEASMNFLKKTFNTCDVANSAFSYCGDRLSASGKKPYRPPFPDMWQQTTGLLSIQGEKQQTHDSIDFVCQILRQLPDS